MLISSSCSASKTARGGLLAQCTGSMEDLIGLAELIISDPSGEFLLAFRLKHRPGQPGQPIIQGVIPFLAVDNQGRTIGELLGRLRGLSGRSYTLWSRGEDYLTVPSASRSAPYPLLQRGVQVALIAEQKPLFARPDQTSWTVRFTAPCEHLHPLALLTHVATHPGASGVDSG